MRRSVIFLFAALLALPPLLVACNDGGLTTSNTPPEVLIQQPVDGSLHSAVEPLELRGRATDRGAGGGIAEIGWSSDISGVLFEGDPDDEDGNTSFSWVDAEAGDHVLTLRATDVAGASASTSVTLTVVANAAPTCQITAPTGAEVLDSSHPIVVQGQVDDDNTAPPDLVIRWESDVDGLLDEAPASEAGVVDAEVTLTGNNHELSLRVTDEDGLVCTDSVYIVTNAAPSAPGLSFDPIPPSIDQDLSVLVTTESVDPEGGEVQYKVRWFLDGVEYPIAVDLPQDAIPAADLARDQEWTVEGYGMDELEVQSEVTTIQTIVPDSAPGAPGVTVTPAAPTQAQDLLCAVTTDSVDPDPVDTVGYTFDWLLAGSPTAYMGALLPWQATTPGEDWTCSVTPDDGTLLGTPGEATVTVEQGCFSFEGDGLASQAIVPDAADLRLGSGSFTVEAWVKADSLPGSDDAAIVSKRLTGSDNGWYFAVDASGTPFFQVSIGANPRLDATEDLSIGAWHHVAVVYDSGSSQGTFFVDGAPSGSAALPQPNGAATADLYIGNDGALSGRVWDGLIDDVRVSQVARYGITFIPDTSLTSDADTLALWGFEEGSGTAVADLSGGGFDGVLAGGGFSAESTCELDLPPTAPVIALSPDYPDDADALTCSLLTPSVDPEGASVGYDGSWLVDGAPSGNTFTTFPATLPGSATDEGEEWTCQVVASDGAQTSVPVSLSVHVGSFEVCSLLVVDPSSAGSTACAFEAPISGLLRFTMDNPDASADGQFIIDLGTMGTSWLFTGFKDWAYDGETIEPWAEAEMELNVTPSLGPLTVTVQYDPSPGTDNTGPDELLVEFIYNDQLSTSGATLIGQNTVTSAESSDDTPAATNVSATIAAGERLLLEADPCGSAGMGAHGIYASDDGLPGNDGLVRVDTGVGQTCVIPLRSLTISPGSWDFSIVHEDDFWTDNSGERGLTLYRYVP